MYQFIAGLLAFRKGQMLTGAAISGKICTTVLFLSLIVMVLIQAVVQAANNGILGMFGGLGRAWLNILRNNVYAGIIALSMCFAIISGGIDLSVGSIIAMSGVLGAAAVVVVSVGFSLFWQAARLSSMAKASTRQVSFFRTFILITSLL